MPFKTNLPDASCPALSGFSVLAFEGRDAGGFLQSQAMNDVRALAPGQWQWNGWLTPKGRVIALFALLRVDADRYWAVLPDYPAVELKARLQNFVFRSKLVISADPDVVAASGPVCAGAQDAQAAGEPATGLALDVGGAGGTRTLWLLPTGHAALAGPHEASDLAWTAADLAHGLPRLPAAQREAWTPQMLSLERLSAFSLKKGCYPGQEIVSRTHYLGQSKRGLVRLAGVGLEAGSGVDADGKPVGTLACALPDGSEGLAVLAADAGDALSSGGQACRRLQLLDGLARMP